MVEDDLKKYGMWAIGELTPCLCRDARRHATAVRSDDPGPGQVSGGLVVYWNPLPPVGLLRGVEVRSA